MYINKYSIYIYMYIVCTTHQYTHTHPHSHTHTHTHTQILIEWGCNIYIRTLRGELGFDCVKNADIRTALTARHDYLAKMIPRIIGGDTELLRKLVSDHKDGTQKFASLRSR